MSKFYKIKKCKRTCNSALIIEEQDNIVYEKYIIDYEGKSWKCTPNLRFCVADTSEKLEKFKKENKKYIKEIGKDEVFALMI